MSDRAAFLAHIADHPDADLPRLVFADWLDEQGDPLGEFIRVQIELSHLQDRLGDPETQSLLKREDELLAEHREKWTDGWNLTFERGLPVKLRMNWREFTDTGDPMLTAWPTIRVVSLRDAPRWTHQPIHEAPIGRIRELHLEGWPEAEFVGAILDHPDWDPTATLRLNIHARSPAPQLIDLEPHRAALTRLELVQPFAGAMMGRDWHFLDDTLAELVSDFDGTDGRDLAHLIRPYERLYPLLGDLDGRFFAGHLKSGAPTLFVIAPQGRRVAFCTFTEDGRVDKSLWEDTTEPPWTLDRIRERFGFELGFIRVRDFEANNQLVVRFWWGYVRSLAMDGTFEEEPESADHLADPKHFFVAFGNREVAVSYRTGRGSGAAG